MTDAESDPQLSGLRASPPADRLLRAIPVDLDIVSGPAAGDDVITSVAVKVGGQGILTGHAAIVDGDAIEDRRIGTRPGIEDKDARPSGARCRCDCSGRAGQ